MFQELLKMVQLEETTHHQLTLLNIMRTLMAEAEAEAVLHINLEVEGELVAVGLLAFTQVT